MVVVMPVLMAQAVAVETRTHHTPVPVVLAPAMVVAGRAIPPVDGVEEVVVAGLPVAVVEAPAAATAVTTAVPVARV